MKLTSELVSIRNTENGFFAITFLINLSYYKTFKLSGYSRATALKRARSMANAEAQKDAQFTNQP